MGNTEGPNIDFFICKMGWNKVGMLLSLNTVVSLCRNSGSVMGGGRLQPQVMEELPSITCCPLGALDNWLVTVFFWGRGDACLHENVFKVLSLALGALSLRGSIWWVPTVYLSCVGEHDYNPCTGEAKAEELSVRGHPGLYSEILFPKEKPNPSR